MTATDDDDCGHVVVDGAHHAIPDDGAAHETHRACPCDPELVQLGELVVVEHIDQDMDLW